jgi:hypothetical protein
VTRRRRMKLIDAEFRAGQRRECVENVPLIHQYISLPFSCFIRRMDSPSRVHSKPKHSTCDACEHIVFA